MTGDCASLGLAAALAALPGLSGCSSSPLERSARQGLREGVIATYRQGLGDAEAAPIEVRREASLVEGDIPPERLRELDDATGPGSYAGDVLDPGSNLSGTQTPDAVRITIERAVNLAVEHNLDYRVARLTPAIAAAEARRADSVFDWALFADARFEKQDLPRPAGVVTGLSGDQQMEEASLTTGIRKPLESGGAFTLQTTASTLFNEPTFFVVNRYYTANVTLGVTQPLLRGFGRGVSRANIELARNAELGERENLRRSLLQLVGDVEAAYWDLALQRQRVLILQRLYAATVSEYQRLKQRLALDATEVEVTEAASRAALRRSDLVQARQALREASDRLKQLINDPEMPVTGEVLLLPATDAAVDPIRFSLLDSVVTALQRRPELESALLAIEDADTRRSVARNALLPLLDLEGQVSLNGQDNDNIGGAYDDLASLDYISYVAGLRFEYPLGNRGAEALVERRELERRQAVLNYQRNAQLVALDVKNALRGVVVAYELIGVNRDARRAAARSLAALQTREEVGGAAISPQFINLKLDAQQRVADAETREAQSITSYETSIARLYETMGTLLERKGIDFDAASSVPEDANSGREPSGRRF